MREVLLLAAATAVLTATGIAHGLRTDRWGVAGEVATAARRLEDVPARVGDWEGQALAIDQRQLDMAQVVGHVARRYTHGPTGRGVVVLLVVGRPGAIGAHSPDVCYRRAGFQFANEPAARAVKPASGACTFWQTVAARGEPRPEYLSLWWAWSVDGASWEASKHPRVQFLRSAFLYKLYLIRPVGGPNESDDAPTVALMEELLPKLAEALATPNP